MSVFCSQPTFHPASFHSTNYYSLSMISAITKLLRFTNNLSFSGGGGLVCPPSASIDLSFFFHQVGCSSMLMMKRLHHNSLSLKAISLDLNEIISLKFYLYLLLSLIEWNSTYIDFCIAINLLIDSKNANPSWVRASCHQLANISVLMNNWVVDYDVVHHHHHHRSIYFDR